MITEDVTKVDYYNMIQKLLDDGMDLSKAVWTANKELGLETCYNCRQIFKPTSHHYVHLGGPGTIPKCDYCL